LIHRGSLTASDLRCRPRIQQAVRYPASRHDERQQRTPAAFEVNTVGSRCRHLRRRAGWRGRSAPGSLGHPLGRHRASHSCSRAVRCSVNAHPSESSTSASTALALSSPTNGRTCFSRYVARRDRFTQVVAPPRQRIHARVDPHPQGSWWTVPRRRCRPGLDRVMAARPVPVGRHVWRLWTISAALPWVELVGTGRVQTCDRSGKARRRHLTQSLPATTVTRGA
jgi:hypothetical protein